MTWVTWRQFRVQSITAAAILGALAIVLGATGPNLVSRYDSAGLNTCHAHCSQLAGNFVGGLNIGGTYVVLFYAGIVVMYLTPALIGIFWGAPLVAREFEAGTYRLAWNQSITRTRWAVVKLGLVGLLAMATSGLVCLMISWWARPIDDAISYGGPNSLGAFSRLHPLMFAARGITPLGYAAFAFALGVTAGVVLRRTLPAMAVTLVVFAAVQVLVPAFIRPDILPPDRVIAPLSAANAGLTIRADQGGTDIVTVLGDFSRPGAWILSDQSITPAGHVFAGRAPHACFGNNPQPCMNWIASQHLRQLVTYQPASRFWPLQWIETTLYLALAAVLCGLCTWQIRRRNS
jgi:hypothetical protein